MNLKSIEYFLLTVDEMNFTRAAERLYISQQALSSHIQRLEKEYHIQLFERRPSLHLTLEGQQMVFYGQQILDAEKKMRIAFSDVSENCRGVLTVGISRLRGSLFFPRIWNFYHKSHANISMKLVDGNTNSLDLLLQNGKLDLYIGVDVPAHAGLQRIELAREKLQCCMSQSLLEQCYRNDWQDRLSVFQKGISIQHLSEMPLITMRQGNRLRNMLDAAFSRSVNPQIVIECDQQELIYTLAKQGAGAGILSPVVLYQNLSEIERLGTSFHSFTLTDLPEIGLFLVFRKDYPLPRFAVDFVQTACLVFRNYSRTIDEHFS